jgi:hypothetical protein
MDQENKLPEVPESQVPASDKKVFVVSEASSLH